MSSGPHTETAGGPVMEPPRHQAVKPEWVCSDGCGKWPCITARRRMLTTMGDQPIGLAILMAHEMGLAYRDLWKGHPDGPPDETPGTIWARFLGWTRPLPHPRVRRRGI